MELTIATFISKSETFNPEIIAVGERLRQENIKCELIVFSDHKLEVDNKDLRVIVDGGRTKYRRIQFLLETSFCDFILCLDNDISVKLANLPEFIREFATGKYVAGWGKIEANIGPGIVPELIRLDKMLSHNLIRPLLWKLGVGISIPGQLFLLNKSLLHDSLPPRDTVFDDLQIGLVIRRSGHPVLSIPVVLGAEFPKPDFPQLIKQRTRWARGYAETLINNRASSLLFVLAHGIAYHILWIFLWLSLVMLAYTHGSFLILIFCAFLLTFASRSRAYLRSFVLYALIFPLLHVIWLLAVVLNLARLGIWSRMR